MATTPKKRPGSLFKSTQLEDTTEDIEKSQPQTQTTKKGKHLISGLFEPAAYRQFGVLAAELGLDKRELLRQALNDCFIKHNKPPIA